MIKTQTKKMVEVTEESGTLVNYQVFADVVAGTGRVEFAPSDDLAQGERRASTELTREDCAEILIAIEPIVLRRLRAYEGEDAYKIAMAAAQEAPSEAVTEFVASIAEAQVEHAEAIAKLQEAQSKLKGGR